MKSLHRRVICAVSMLLLAGIALAQRAVALDYPVRPIRIIVPWPPGGTTDVIARLLSKNLTDELHQSVFVDNIAGVGGNIGTHRFVEAQPDGYTLLMASSSTNAANPHLYKSLGFEPIKDFTPIALIARVPDVLVVAADSPFKTFDDVRNAAKAKPGSVLYASSGVGSSANLAGELLKSITQIDAMHVPYKGMAPATLDVLSGRVTYTFETGISGNTESGRLRPLAVTAEKRVPNLADVPTFSELGVNGMQIDVWFGIAGPANLPQEIVNKINAAINNALSKGDLSEQLARLGSDTKPGSPQMFSEFWSSEIARYAELVRLSGAKLE
jgi:tripartite-type tricarboxylate transporter receptor subunit TctC